MTVALATTPISTSALRAKKDAVGAAIGAMGVRGAGSAGAVRCWR